MSMRSDNRTVMDLCQWGSVEHHEGRLDAAKMAFARALHIDPACSLATFGLSSVLLDQGQVNEAETLVDEFNTSGEILVLFLWLKARIAIARAEPGMALEHLSQLLAITSIDGDRRAEALLMKGVVLDSLGDAPGAFEAAVEGKCFQHAGFARQASAREGEVAKLRRIAEWIGTDPAAAIPLTVSKGPEEADTHVFLLGFPRSGTTLLEQVLAMHPRVIALEEAPTLATAYQAFLSDAEACARLARLDTVEAAAWVAHYWTVVRDHGIDVGGKLFVDKQPAGTLNLPVIARLFPRAKILFAIRDPRDVVLSCFRQPFQINAMTYAFTDLAQAAACYDACLRLAGRARAHLPFEWMDVRHETLVEEFDRTLARIIYFLELDADPAMRDFAARSHGRTIRTPSATQVRAGLNRRGIGRWEQYREQLAPILPILAPWVTRLGYSS